MADIRDVIKKIVPKQGRLDWGKPAASYRLTFDSQQAQLEPIYYWILDFIQDGGWKVEKITDNFVSSPGSGHFSEMGQKVTRMQEEGMKILGALNQVIKSVLNLIYDLKEFEIRLEHYDDYRSEDEGKKYRGTLSLKQIWLDTVDIKKGNGSVNVLTSQAGFVTLRDMFFVVNSPGELEKTEIVNEQTKRILTPRLSEFWKWVDYSERELRKRMNIEKSYLRSQVETIKLYSAWMKPYLKAAEQLRQKGFDNDAALVNAFSTSMFELTLFGKKEIDKSPEKFKEYKLKRKYHPLIVIDLKYRGHVSQRVTQKGDFGFAMGGRIDMTFDAYSLNEEELKLVEDELKNEDVAESMTLVGDVAGEALDSLKEDLDYFLKDHKEDDKKKTEEEKKRKKSENDINPFAALFGSKGIFSKKREKKEKKKVIESIKDVKADNFVEKTVRANAAQEAVGGLYAVYDIYKKSHQMASAPDTGFENEDGSKVSEPEVKFGDIFSGQDRSSKLK